MKINPRFRDLIPALSPEELAGLEASLASEGCRDPLVVWRGTVVDGHNRLEICKRLKLPYTTVEHDFDSEDDACLWIIDNQFARRNLAPFTRAELSKKREGIVDLQAKAKANLSAGGGDKKSKAARSGLADLPKAIAPTPINVRKERARISGLSERTIAKSDVVAERAPPDVLAKLRAGESSIDAEYKAIRSAEKRTETVARIQEIARNSDAEIPNRRYPVLYVDPPWAYDRSTSDTDSSAARSHYPTMSVDDLCDWDVVRVLAAPDAALFLWVTSPLLAEAFDVVSAWGFKYKASIIWDKGSGKQGFYSRGRHEQLLICTRGEMPTVDPKNRPESVICAPREGHSVKPAVFAEVIQRMYPDFERIEIFARKPREGWSVWGNQSDGV